jgi:hypothetical protein
MKILNIKSWLQRKEKAKFEFVGNHKIRKLADGQEFKLRFMYNSVVPNVKLCIVYAYTDLIHVDLASNDSDASLKINISQVKITNDGDKEILELLTVF